MKATFEKKETISIYKSNDFDAKLLSLLISGCGMSERWWSETYKMKDKGELVGVYKTQSGKLRRTTIWR